MIGGGGGYKNRKLGNYPSVLCQCLSLLRLSFLIEPPEKYGNIDQQYRTMFYPSITLSYLTSLGTTKYNNDPLSEVFVKKNRAFASEKTIKLYTSIISGN